MLKSNLIALAIGYGGDFPFYANSAAQRFERFTGIPTKVISEEEILRFQNRPIMAPLPDLVAKSYYMRLFMFELVPDDDVICFDADYACINHWNPRDGYDGTFTAVRDRGRRHS